MTVSSASQVAARMQKVGSATRTAQAKTVKVASEALKAGVQSTSPARLRNVGKGAALSVRVTSTAGSNPTSTGTAIGPWPIIEYDTPTHLIGIGKGARKRAKVTVSNGAALGGFLKGPGYGHPVRGPIVHPGTKGKLVFHKGVAKGTPKAVAEMRATNLKAVGEAFS